MSSEKLITMDPDDMDSMIASTVGILLPCPFCGGDPLTMRQVNQQNKNVVAKVFCQCLASVIYVHKDPEKARSGAIQRWQLRTP